MSDSKDDLEVPLVTDFDVAHFWTSCLIKYGVKIKIKNPLVYQEYLAKITEREDTLPFRTPPPQPKQKGDVEVDEKVNETPSDEDIPSSAMSSTELCRLLQVHIDDRRFIADYLLSEHLAGFEALYKHTGVAGLLTTEMSRVEAGRVRDFFNTHAMELKAQEVRMTPSFL